jgi:hypothetical protein
MAFQAGPPTARTCWSEKSVVCHNGVTARWGGTTALARSLTVVGLCQCREPPGSRGVVVAGLDSEGEEGVVTAAESSE